MGKEINLRSSTALSISSPTDKRLNLLRVSSETKHKSLSQGTSSQPVVKILFFLAIILTLSLIIVSGEVINLSQLADISIDGSFDDWVNITNVSDAIEDYGFISVGGGHYHTCGLYNNGTVYCWGYGGNGQLGDGRIDSHSVGLATTLNTTNGLINNFTTIAVGYLHTCGINSTGAAYCWGSGDYGQLGDGISGILNHELGLATALNTTSGLINNFTTIASGRFHTCGINATGAAYCWGQGLGGTLGDGNVNDHNLSLATAINTSNGLINNFREIAAGYGFACAINATGAVYCWGNGDKGQVGDGSIASHSVGLAKALNTTNGVKNLTNNFTTIAAGRYHICGVHVNGTVYCWGWGRYGAVGDGRNDDHDVGLATALNTTNGVINLTNNFTTIAAGDYQTCGIHVNGTVYCWGQGDNSALGDGRSDAHNITLAAGLNTSNGLVNNFKAIGVGDDHGCGVHNNGTIYCWGLGSNGQLGDNNINTHNVSLALMLNTTKLESPPIFDLQIISLANNATYLFAKMITNDSIDFSTATRYYAVYISTNDATTGSQYTAGAGLLPFLYDYRIQVNNSVCTIYNYTNQSKGSCNYSNSSNAIEISANLTLINLTQSSIANITIETGSTTGTSYDFAPDYDSFISLALASASSCLCPGAATNWNINLTHSCNITEDCDITTGYLNFTDTGYVRFNATINCTGMHRPEADQVVYVEKNALIWVH